MLSMEEIRQGTWLVIAAYNEASVIHSVVAEAHSKYPNVIVIDDGSTDETGAEAVKGGAILITHPINLGQGAALKTGITFALRQNAEFIVTFDADGQHNIEDVDSMLEAVDTGNYDVALGSRFCGTSKNLPRVRFLILKAAVLFTRISTGLKLTDTHNGLRVIRAEAARRIKLQQNGMAHASEILEQIAKLNLSYIEVPVTIRYTDYSLRKGQKLSNSVNILMDLVIERFIR